MRVLVTGAAGFIGTHLVSNLAQSGVSVVVIDRNKSLLPTISSNIRHVVTDITNSAAISSALQGVDVVYHLAWSGLPLSSNEDPNLHIASNLTPTIVLLEACAKSSVKRVVFLSSGGAVYGHAAKLPITEKHPTHPLSIYGVTKLAVESYLDFYWRQYNLDYVVLRPSVPYGESQNTRRGQGAVGVFLRAAITNAPITLWGGREVSRDFFYVGDLVKACLAAADEGVKRGVYNIGGGKAISLGNLLNMVEEITNTKISVTCAPARNCDPSSICLDITKARHGLCWEPEVELSVGIERTWTWLKSLNFTQAISPKSRILPSSTHGDSIPPSLHHYVEHSASPLS